MESAAPAQPEPAGGRSPLRARQPGASPGSILFYILCRKISRAVVWAFFGLRADGVENVPPEGALLLVANHQSYLDPPAIGSVITKRNLDYIAKAELFRVPLLGPLIRTLNSIPVHGGAQDIGSIKEVLAHLAIGRGTLIFPEGGRSEDGEMKPFKRGAALLVKRARCRVVPVAIDGAYKAWPPGRAFPLPWSSRVRVRFGGAIEHEELMKDGPDAAVERLEREVAALLRTLRGEDPSAGTQRR
ncbi:MAG TPA: lysophospholipid acyltransferase family protein [Phycisphaerales bacterium]|nr:lysophospholipid acyltransferase family protein [Phycisphaerales bacterium]